MKARTRGIATHRSAIWLASVACALFLAGAAAPVTAGGEARIDEVLGAWTDALGGRDLLAGIENLHTRSTVAMYGMDGTLEAWITADGHHRFDLDLAGIINLSVIRTPSKCWYLDQNGKVSEWAGKNLEDEIRDVYLDTWSHLLPGRMAGGAELLPPDAETGQLRVKILPRGGTEATFWIDPRTHLPVRWESPGETGETVTTTLSEWREFEGVLFPARLLQSSGTEENDIAAELTEVRVNEPLPEGVFSPPAESQADYRFADGRSATDIPLDIDGVHIFVQVRLNESDPLWFVLDSGAEMTCIDQQAAEDLGLELTGQTMGSGNGPEEVAVSFVPDASFSLPGVELTGQTVAALALRAIVEPRLGREVDGILGYDFISRFVVEIDYQNEKLNLYDRDGWEYDGSGTEVPIWLVDKVPNCKATYTLPDGSSEDCNVYVDIGSGSTLKFNKPYTEEHHLLSTLAEKIEYRGGFGIGGQTSSYMGRIASLKIGDLEFKDPVCSFSRDEKGGRKYTSLAAQLGGGVLERCTVVLDYERQRMFLAPNDRFGTAFPGPMCGLTVVTGGRGDWHTFTVVNVVEGSPAHAADVRVGDVIVTVDGRSASELRMAELTDMFRQEGRRISLGVKRDGRILEKELRIKPML